MKKIITPILILLFCNLSFADDVDEYFLFKKRLKVDNKKFDYSVSGLRDYLDGEKESKPELYNKFNPDLEDLEFKRTLGLTTVITSTIVGVGIGASGYTVFAKDETKEVVSGQTVTERKPNFTIVYIGGGIALAGALTGLLIMPGKADLNDFIRKHNSYNKPESIRIDLGSNPWPERNMFAKVTFFY